MKKIIIALFSSLLVVVSCKKNPTKTKKNEEKSIEKTFSQRIESAHKKMLFLTKEAIQFDAYIEFGGNEVFNANVTASTTSDIAKISYKNGDEIYVNKENIFVSPSLKENKGVRFHAYTWTYFFLFPYKLNDQGTKWNDSFNTESVNHNFDISKLTFKENTGDAPDDWYIVYTNKDNHRLDHAAYIVTVNKSLEDAEADPHAIKYLDFTNIDGIPLSKNWEFYGWNLDKDLTTKIGSAKLTNIHFVENFRKEFIIPKDYIKK